MAALVYHRLISVQHAYTTAVALKKIASFLGAIHSAPHLHRRLLSDAVADVSYGETFAKNAIKSR